MNEIVVPSEDLDRVRSYLRARDVEGCAIFYASRVQRRDGTIRILAQDFQLPTADDYASATSTSAELVPEFVARATKRARLGGFGLIFVHSHPGDEHPNFSRIDDRGETRLSAFLDHRLPGSINVALVISEGGLRARLLGQEAELRVVSLGGSRDVLFDPNMSQQLQDEQYDRQIRAFGIAGQTVLQSLSIAIVGLGGTGSLVAEQLAHLGVRSFTLIDPDTLETTNLNRVVGATRSSVLRPKVDVAADHIHRIAAGASVDAIKGDVVSESVAARLKDVDCIFGCTDSHGSRSILQQIAYQYLIPYFDVGTVIATSEGEVTHISGRAQMLSPGLACFACDDFLDPEEVRRDLLSDYERRADPYILGEHEPAPAVISINSTVSSLAVTMFLSAFTKIPSPARHLIYDAKRSLLRKICNPQTSGCYICSKQGALARGDAWPLFARAE